jgi:hypothetical protein
MTRSRLKLKRHTRLALVRACFQPSKAFFQVLTYQSIHISSWIQRPNMNCKSPVQSSLTIVGKLGWMTQSSIHRTEAWKTVSTISRSKLFPYMVIPHLGKIDIISTTAGRIISRPIPFESPLNSAHYRHIDRPRQWYIISLFGNSVEEHGIALLLLCA